MWGLPRPVLLATVLAALLLQGRRRGGGEGPAVCSGSTRDAARCVFRDALVANGTVYFLDPGGAGAVPPLLCSIANNPAAQTAGCDVRAVRHRGEWAALAAGAEDVPAGVMLGRLSPRNLYHVLFEEVVPATSMAWDAVGGVAADGTTKPFALFALDSNGRGNLDERLLSALAPGVRLVHRDAGTFRVGRLVAGTRAACTHRGHCLGPEGIANRTFEPPDAAVHVRRGIFADIGATEPAAAPPPRLHPRITVVQRTRTRRFAPHALAAMNATLTWLGGGRAPGIVDFASLDPPAQVRLAAQTDLLVLVHGAALGHLLFLPPFSAVLEVYPHAVPAEHHGLVQGILSSLAPAVPLSHFPLQIRGAEGQLTHWGPLPANCTCPDEWCEARTLWNTVAVAPDPREFARRAAEAADAWRRGLASVPRTAGEQARYWADVEAAEGAAEAGAPACWTVADQTAWEELNERTKAARPEFVAPPAGLASREDGLGMAVLRLPAGPGGWTKQGRAGSGGSASTDWTAVTAASGLVERRRSSATLWGREDDDMDSDSDGEGWGGNRRASEPFGLGRADPGMRSRTLPNLRGEDRRRATVGVLEAQRRSRALQGAKLPADVERLGADVALLTTADLARPVARRVTTSDLGQLLEGGTGGSPSSPAVGLQRPPAAAPPLPPLTDPSFDADMAEPTASLDSEACSRERRNSPHM
ncbi:hypothetical protein DFJ74DRAFT_772124 [Hyaloraphidium curvatum]|nr:hypothetical protein DFJ74DRAFT_772124 [Hyaloraphidium curvatum]